MIIVGYFQVVSKDLRRRNPTLPRSLCFEPVNNLWEDWAHAYMIGPI